MTAVELVAYNLELLRSQITADMAINALQGDGRMLSMLPDASYDLTLVLGPMYHLYHEADKMQVISEALRVTKPGGVVMVAYAISEGSIVEYVFKQGRLKEVFDDGMLDPVTFTTSSSVFNQYLFEMVRKTDVDRLMSHYPVERLHYIATDGLSYFMRQELEQMDTETFQTFLQYHLAVCENADLVGATAHSLDIFRKRG